MSTKTGNPPKRRVLAFIRHLNKLGGCCEIYDSGHEWHDRYCGDYEPTDTYNRAHELGWARTTHDTSSDDSTLFITDAGRAALTETNHVER